MDSSTKEEVKAEVDFKIEPSDEETVPGIAFAPIAFDPAAQVAALAVEEAAPVLDDEEAEEKPDLKPAIQAIHVAAVRQAIKNKPKEEPESEGEDEAREDEDPYGLGPRRSRSPPASRAQRRSIQATASQRPRSKTKFYPSR